MKKHHGYRFSAGLGHLFTEWPLCDRFSIAAEQGFNSVELTLPYEEKAEHLEAARTRAGVDVVVFTAPVGDFLEGGEGCAAVPGKEQEFRESIGIALEYAEALGARYTQFVAGRCDSQETSPDKRLRYLDTFANNLQYAATAFYSLPTIPVLEAINTRDYPDYLLSLPQHLWQIIGALGEEKIGAVLDTAHAAAMGVNPIDEINCNGTRYCHIQLADAPARGAPGSGDLDFSALYQAIASSDYGGDIGFEFYPQGSTLDSLACVEVARLALSNKAGW